MIVNQGQETVSMLKYTAFIFVGTYAMGATCDSLKSLSLAHTTITMAQEVPAGTYPQPAADPLDAGAPFSFKDLATFCRVALTLKPSDDSDIKVEVWLPVNGWNHKFEAVGNGGWAGSITYGAMGRALNLGYASASTDTGHSVRGANFALGHPEKVVDFGWRAVHEMTVTAKELMKAYYGEAPKYSYWNSCSQGGRQGLMEAQRFPTDYDGIIAGAPAINWTGRSTQAVWIAQATHKDEASALTPAKLAVIHEAVIAACDAIDGVKDGVLEDPTKCKFDPKSIQCKDADAANCLTAAQVETVRKIYADPTNPRTKKAIFQGHEPGGETGWTTMAGPNPFTIASDLFKYVVFEDPNWDYKTLNFDSDIDRALKANAAVDALNPNLKPFLDRKGKIIQYHGWSDPQISPRSSVEYYKSVVEVNGGASKVSSDYRLFMVPGMAHCGRGDGTSTFGMLTALEQWVEQGKAPDRIEASRVRNGQTDRTRPLCAYPQVATYKGSGSTDDTANFVCK